MCNVVGVLVYDNPSRRTNASRIARKLMHDGQGRGQHAASIISLYAINPGDTKGWFYDAFPGVDRVSYHRLSSFEGDRRLYCTFNGLGTVDQLLTNKIITDLYGNIVIGGNRYPTTGDDYSYENTKNPRRYKESSFGENGDLINAAELKAKLSDLGFEFKPGSSSDVDVGVKLFHHYYESLGSGLESMKAVMKEAVGAYFFIATTPNSIVVAKDFNNVKPGGFIKTRCEHVFSSNLEDLLIVSSESGSAFSTINLPASEFRRQWTELQAGEVYEFFKDGTVDYFKFTNDDLPDFIQELGNYRCHFEPIYIMRKDSFYDGENTVESFRKDYGYEWARQIPDEVASLLDFIVPVLETGDLYALGITQCLRDRGFKVDYAPLLFKDKYSNRTFLKSTTNGSNTGLNISKLNIVKDFDAGNYPKLNNIFESRDQLIDLLSNVLSKQGLEKGRRHAVKMKHSASLELAGKHIMLADDTINRLNTMYVIVPMMREKGEAAGVSVGVMDAPVVRGCPCAVDLRGNLIAGQLYNTLEAMKLTASSENVIEILRGILNADHLYYGSPELIKKFFDGNCCTGCIGGDYPPSIYLRERNVLG